MAKNLVYDIHDKPTFSKILVFAFQQLLAIMAATIAVPAIVGNGMSASAALFGAGVGTLVYQLFTKFRSPVFLGSSFAFIGSMSAAFAGAISVSVGYLGLLIGAACAGLVYVVIALVVKFVGVGWINKLMPAAVIGPTVAIIGLSLAGAAVKDVFSYGPTNDNGAFIMTGNIWISFNNLEKYVKNGDRTAFVFKNNKRVVIDFSYYIIDNQVTRSLMLDYELKKRRESLEK